jgi:TRAP-type C4-dicarboxylate transport system permease large subunit
METLARSYWSIRLWVMSVVLSRNHIERVFMSSEIIVVLVLIALAVIFILWVRNHEAQARKEQQGERSGRDVQ